MSDSPYEPKFLIIMWALECASPTAVARRLGDPVTRKFTAWARDPDGLAPAFIEALLARAADIFQAKPDKEFLLECTPLDLFCRLAHGRKAVVLQRSVNKDEPNSATFLEIFQPLKRDSAGSVASPNHVEILNSWNSDKALEILRGAEETLTIIDSFVRLDDSVIADCVGEALRRRNSKKQFAVYVYMLDPAYPFGGQRRLEIEKSTERRTEKEPLSHAVWKKMYDEEHEAYVRNYRAEMLVFQSDLVRAFKENEETREAGVIPQFFYSPLLPGMRIYSVDGKSCIVGWYPFLRVNPGFSCLPVHKGTPFHERVIGQLEFIKSVSREAGA